MTVSLFLILLTFFILLNSIAVIDESRKRAALGSLIGAFGGLPGGLSPLDTGDSLMPPSAPMVHKTAALSTLMSHMDRALAGQVKAHADTQGDTISVNAGALFMGSIYDPNPDLDPFFKSLGRLINQGDYPVEIVGHTDATPAQAKGFVSNWELSTLMAIQVLKRVVTVGRVSPARLSALGCGAFRPLVSNDTPLSRAQNRRVEIILHVTMPTRLKRLYQKKPSGFFTYKHFDFKIF